MNVAHFLEACMLVCFGFSWPINVVKAYKARSAKSTSLAFILLIITGYIAGISAKMINHQYNYVLVVYFLNLVIVFSNVLVYFRNCALDKSRETEPATSVSTIKPVYAHEEQIIISDKDSRDAKAYNVALLGGTYDVDIPVDYLAKEFEFDFDLYNKSTFALTLSNAKLYYERYVANLNSDGILIHLGMQDKELFKSNPSLFDTQYLALIAAIRSHNKDCRLCLVSVNNPNEDKTIENMNNHIKAIAQSEQADYINLANAKLWNPMATKSAVDFAMGMGLKIKKPLYDIAEILYSYAYQNIAEVDVSVAV